MNFTCSVNNTLFFKFMNVFKHFLTYGDDVNTIFRFYLEIIHIIYAKCSQAI